MTTKKLKINPEIPAETSHVLPEEFFDRQEAFRLAETFKKLNAGEKLLFFNQNFSKRLCKYLWRDLQKNHSFAFDFDHQDKDETLWDDLDYLFNRKTIFNLPIDFQNYLSNLIAARPEYNRIASQRDDIDDHLQNFLSIHSFADFTLGVFSCISERKTNKLSSYFSKKDITEKPRYFDAVAAATYLLQRGNDLRKQSAESRDSSPSSIQTIFKDTCLYLYEKQQFFNVSYFGNQCNPGWLQSSFKRSQDAVDTDAGVQMEEITEQEDRTDDFSNIKTEEDLKRFFRHRIVEEAKVFGIPEKSYRSFYFYKNLTFEDVFIVQMALALSLFVGGVFASPLETKKDLNHFLIDVLRNGGKAKSMLNLLVSSPDNLIDLYQSPFIEMGQRLYYSKQLILEDNFLRNMASRAAKLDGGKSQDKGALFQAEAISLLRADGWKVADNIPISFPLEGKMIIGDIDIAAEKEGWLFLFECKSDIPAQDYFDFRRNASVVEKGTIEVEKSLLFLADDNGRKKLEERLGVSLANHTIRGAILCSNCYSSCQRNLRFPVYSLFEIKNAINEGSVILDGKTYPLRAKAGTMQQRLESKQFPRIVKDSLHIYPLRINSFLKETLFEDYCFDHYGFCKRLNKIYDCHIPLGLRVLHAIQVAWIYVRVIVRDLFFGLLILWAIFIVLCSR
jgi:hypothetical protein